MSLYALGGGELAGDKLVRFVYLDESGISNPDEKYIVVAGVIIDGDKHWKLIEKHLAELVGRFIPEAEQEGFFFHATDIHHGSGLTPRDRYGRDLRITMLRELCEIPLKFSLPVVAGFIKWSELEANMPSVRRHEQVITGQAIASCQCAASAEVFMRTQTDKGEIARLIYENNDNARSLIREAHNYLRTPKSLLRAEQSGRDLSKILPFRRIVGAAGFEEKLDTSLLQVADACAFAIRRQLMAVDKEAYFLSIGAALLKNPGILEHSLGAALFWRLPWEQPA